MSCRAGYGYPGSEMRKPRRPRPSGGPSPVPNDVAMALVVRRAHAAGHLGGTSQPVVAASTLTDRGTSFRPCVRRRCSCCSIYRCDRGPGLRGAGVPVRCGSDQGDAKRAHDCVDTPVVIRGERPELKSPCGPSPLQASCVGRKVKKQFDHHVAADPRVVVPVRM